MHVIQAPEFIDNLLLATPAFLKLMAARADQLYVFSEAMNLYVDTGNIIFLVDAVNYCRREFMAPSYADAHRDEPYTYNYQYGYWYDEANTDIQTYHQTHNLSALIAAANFCLGEFFAPNADNAHVTFGG